MHVASVPVLSGAAIALGGLWLLWHGWVLAVGSGELAAGVASLGAGTLLALLGLLMFAGPLLVPVLYRIYGAQAFTSRGGACPVVQKCARCGEFSFRGRGQCKACGSPLVWEAQA